MTRLPDIPFPANMMFLHPVGISTFKYGVTIPVVAQTERMQALYEKKGYPKEWIDKRMRGIAEA